MNYKEYVNGVLSTAIFPQEYKYEYPRLGINEEAGEVAGKIKKIIRDNIEMLCYQPDEWCVEKRYAISLELGDVCWYTAYMSYVLDITLSDIDMDVIASRAENKIVRTNSIIRLSLELCDDANSLSLLFAPAATLKDTIANDAAEYHIKDVYVTISAISLLLGYSLDEIMRRNLEKLASRAARGKLGGSGDNR